MLQEMADAHKTNLHHQPNTQALVFLPMLCSRSSFKDVKWVDEVGIYSSRDEDEPLSPKVGCMGQVKRNSRVIGFPTPNSRTPVGARAGGGKYSKLKRMFSAAAVAMPASPAVNRCRAAGRSAAERTSGTIYREKEKGVIVSIVNMDPPRPVTRKVKKDGDAAGDGEGDRGSLWKRRSDGRMDLKKLEIQNTFHNQGHLNLQLLTV
ncbi:hypothetical protein MLD38_001393 [Melastoma candidum]|uniref:Uncharacterized protein n=1 Tax=Melastoma candidum TaxID=119954 RepID=A0ACB9SGF1_9MYRT|nr:hypothetical protein MLD38_001393 [Melastoma candidum]